MEIERNNGGLSDDEDDLELLRTAALQTIKKSFDSVTNPVSNVQMGYGGMQPQQGKRGRGFQAGPGRGGWNGHFNNRTRNTNLISIPTVQPTETTDTQPIKQVAPAPKLVLPQDRYCSKVQDSEVKTASSKFSRYDNSDESESEEESVASDDTDTEEGKGLKRADSLEELMKELENEISGEKPKPAKVKVKKRMRVRRVTEINESPTKVTEEAEKQTPTVVEVEKRPPSPIKEKPQSPPIIEKPQSPPIIEKNPPIANGGRGNYRYRPNFIPQNLPTYPAYPPQPTVIYNEPPAPLFNNPPYSQPPPYHPPPTFRPLSPLNLNTAALSTITMAPLSPRSAAFVLQNREIIERRRKSPPRKSYSRSPSPTRFRTRAPSPRRYPRSLSPPPPKKNGRIVRHSPPPKRRPITPPKPKPATPPPTSKSVRERLGARKEETKRKRTPTPTPEVTTPTKILKTDDPVLEARRKKFEETPVKEGIIKLKPKEAEVEEPMMTDDDTLELGNLDDIFDDEESDEENEGRFKSSSSTAATKRIVVPFSQLVNGGPNKDVKDKPLDELICAGSRGAAYRKERRREDDRRKRAPSPRSRRRDTTRVTSPIENKRIEIKIRNPAKYEDAPKKDRSSRKVAIAKSEVTEVAGDENDADRKTEGDLRAQLSRKRAERQHKQPVAASDCQTRLLQNALQGAVFKKPRKSKEDKETAPKDKLPIHLRLGGTKDSDSKRKKSKNRSTEQV